MYIYDGFHKSRANYCDCKMTIFFGYEENEKLVSQMNIFFSFYIRNVYRTEFEFFIQKHHKKKSGSPIQNGNILHFYL